MKRKHVITLAAAVAVVAALAGASFALQALALRPPPTGSFAALQAAKWLRRYRLVSSTFTLAPRGRPLHATCVQQWFSEGRRRRMGAVVRLDDGFVLVDLPPHTLVLAGGRAADHAAAPLALLELAGCPRVLAGALENLARARLVSVAGHTARLKYHGTQLALSLDPASGQPFALTVTSRRTSGSSRFRFERLTPSLLRRLGRAQG